MQQFITNMKVSELIPYREFDRVSNPAPKIAILQQYNVDQVTEWVRLNGIAPLELSICDDKALLTDGNHRIAAAARLNIDIVPVKVTYYQKSELTTYFYTHTINRFKKVE